MVNFDNFDDQLVLSYELLHILRFIIEHDAEGLKKLIARAVEKGVLNNKTEKTIEMNGDEIQHSIIDFLTMMEILLHEYNDERSMRQAMQRNLIPSLGKLDSHAYNTDEVRASLTKATSKLERHPGKNPQEILYAELLKRFKPSKKKSDQH